MELRHLRYFIAVAEEESFVGAAARLHLAQPALSRQIRDLETEIGVELFVRTPTGARLTAAGEVCARMARELLHKTHAAVEYARLAEHGLVGRVVLGASRYPLWNGLLGRLIEHVRGEYRGIEIVVEERSLRQQWDELADCRLDIAFGTAPPPDFMQFAVETHSLDVLDGVMVAASHPLADRTSVTLKELAAHTWVRYAPAVSDEPTRNLQTVLTSVGFVPAQRKHATSDDALRMLVRAGAGWSALPRTLHGHLPRDLVAIPVEDLAVPFRYVHIHRRNDTRAIVRSVLKALRRSALVEGSALGQEPDSGIKPLPDASGPAARLELRHLRYFVATVEYETIGRAAEHLEITQPALSRQLRDLEEDVGAALLERTTRGVIPTLPGLALYSDATRILQVAASFASEARRAQRGTQGGCVVGLAASPMVWDVITRGVVRVTASMPDVDVTVDDVPTYKQGAALRDGRVDLAIGHRYPSLPDMDPSVVRSPLLPDTLDVALVSVTHPLAKRGEISLQDLGDLPFLFMKRDTFPAFYDTVISTMARADYTPRIEGTYDGIPTCWALAAQGMGWTIGGSTLQQHPPNGLAAVRIRDFQIPWGCEVAYRQDESRPAVLEVLQAIRDAARDIAAGGASMGTQETKYWSRKQVSA